MNRLLRVGGVPEHFNYPWRLAKTSCDWKEFPGGSGAMKLALQSGEIDVALMLTEAAVAAVALGGNFKILGAYTSSPLTWGVHASAARPDARDRVAVSRMGSGSHLMALVKYGQKDLVVVGDLDGARTALKQGTADLFMWEKFMTKSIVDSGEWTRVDEVPTPWPCFAVVATDAIMEQRPTDVIDLLGIVRDHASNVTPADIAKDYGLPEPDVVEWFPTCTWCCKPHMPRATMSLVVDTLKKANILDADHPYESLVFTNLTEDKPLT